MRILCFILLTPLLCLADDAEDLAENEAFLEQEALEHEQNLPDPFSPEFLLPFETPAAAETGLPEPPPVQGKAGTNTPSLIDNSSADGRGKEPVVWPTSTPALKRAQERRLIGQEGALDQLLDGEQK
jgi:hypothetical protein